jgi:hypothetical protein
MHVRQTHTHTLTHEQLNTDTLTLSVQQASKLSPTPPAARISQINLQPLIDFLRIKAGDQQEVEIAAWCHTNGMQGHFC